MANEKKTTQVTTEVKKWYETIFITPYSKIKWLITELINIYSNKPSYFSKKRVESGVAFAVAQWGMIVFLLKKMDTLTMGEFLLWAAAEFAVSGYIINKIQKEKSANADTSTDEQPQ